MEALPTYYPQIQDPTSVLAGLMGLGAAHTPAPSAPQHLYRAWDGTPVGYSTDCDPLTAEPYLSGLGGAEDPMFVPAIMADNRIRFWETLSVPLLAGTMSYSRGAPPWMIVAWALGGYMAPYPVAAWLGYQLWYKRWRANRGEQAAY